MCWMGCAANTALRRYVGARALRRAFIYYSWSKEFLGAGKRRLAGDTARAATNSEVKDLRRQAQELKEVVAERAGLLLRRLSQQAPNSSGRRPAAAVLVLITILYLLPTP